MTIPHDLMYPLPLNAPRVPAGILLPRGFSCCWKLPAHDHVPVVGLLVFSIAHGYTRAEGLWSSPCSRLYSHRRALIFSLPKAILPPKDFSSFCCFSGAIVPLPKTGPDGADDYIRTETAPSASASASRNWSPLRSALAGTLHPPCSSYHRQSVLTMVAQHRCCARGG